MATFNGWSIGIFAAMSVPFAPFSIVGFLMAVGLAVVAYNEFRGRTRLLDFDPASTALLGWNQLGLLALITGYCLWMLWTGLAGASSATAELRASPELSDALGSLGEFDELYSSD